MAARHLLLLLTGCSLTLSGPDPNRPRNKLPVCDTSKTLVAIDGVLAAGLSITTLATASSGDGSAAVVPALLALAFISSAVHGNNVTNACHREMENYDQVMDAHELASMQHAVAQPAVAAPGMTAPVVPSRAAAQRLPSPAVAAQQQGAPDADDQQEPAESPTPAPAPPKPAPPPANDRWSAFWREVP